MFYPLLIATVVAVIVEQLIRRTDDEISILISMRVRKFLYRQTWIVNIAWFVGYIIIMIMVKGQSQPQMPDMIWKG
tara:strand:- start:10 stop:237 length:228 start_codon:yes stop_codon:yes gene_type:complete